MSDYTQITDYSTKDALASGDAAKRILGSEIDAEFGAIATAIASKLNSSGGTDLAVADGGTGASTAADARTNLGLGTMAVQAASAVAITGGSVAGINDLAVADGGTGASTAANARTNLGLGTIATYAATDVSTVLARDVSTNSVTNTSVETTVFAYTVPGGTLSTNRMIRITAVAKYTNSSGANQSFAIKVKYGGTVVAYFDHQAVTTDATNSRMIYMAVNLTANNATNAQSCTGTQSLGPAQANGGGGIAHSTHVSGHTDLAIDSTINQNIEMSCAHSTAATTVIYAVYGVQVELV